MMAEKYERPDPDQLLVRIKAEAEQQARGKLKIFLGYVAGVGKTYSMLDAAHQRKAEGLDVVVGYIETHGRKETEALLTGLEVLPRREIEYHGVTMSEMDLDAIIARRPNDGSRLLVLVDELAHTNAPGSRHPKRYQDVEEILSAGIDVYTTVNIQHVESLNDVVQQITGIKVYETVPDRIIDEADEVELVDLPPDELLTRLREGKVYVPEQISRALNNYFRKGNLNALRELSLRRVAERVDDDMVDYMHTESIPGPWPAGDRVMVCINTSPFEERLVRAGKRLADDLNAEWYAVFVETPGYHQTPVKIQARIQRNLQLAEELGANAVRITGQSIADTVIDFAHQNNITKIVVGKPAHPYWYEILSGSVIDQIIRKSGQIDVYIASDGAETPQKASDRILPDALTPHKPFGRYSGAVLMVLIATLLAIPLRTVLAPVNVFMLYLISVVLSALYLGQGPSILASVLSVLAYDFFFSDPRFTFTISDFQYLLTFAGLFLVSQIISNSTELLHNQVEIFRRKDQLSQALNRLSRDLSSTCTSDQVLDTVTRDMSDVFKRETVILMPQKGQLTVRAFTPGFSLNDNELAIAEWVFKHGKEAGRGTTTVPGEPARFVPLITAKKTIGVLGDKPQAFQDSQDDSMTDQRLLIEDVVNLIAIALDRASLIEDATQFKLTRDTDNSQTFMVPELTSEG